MTALPLAVDLKRGVGEPAVAERCTLQLPGICQHPSHTKRHPTSLSPSSFSHDETVRMASQYLNLKNCIFIWGGGEGFNKMHQVNEKKRNSVRFV
jgi:hypothetical protein